MALHIDCNHQRSVHLQKKLETIGFDMIRATSLQDAEVSLDGHIFNLILLHEDALGKKIVSCCNRITDSFEDSMVIAILNRFKMKIEEQLFDAGADDVVVGKQAISRLLFKRIKARLRKQIIKISNDSKIRLCDTIVDFERREVWCNGKNRILPGLLKDLLKYFIDNPGRVISRDELLNSHMWQDSICSSAKEGGKTFDVNIGKLRKIVESNPKKPKIIQSVRGEGWKLGTHIVSNLNN